MERLISLDEKLICLNVSAETKEEVMIYLYEKLNVLNYVKDSFISAILEREKVFPTGLPLANMGIAIPHTDPQHVISPTLAVTVLDKPVIFQMMGNPEQSIDVEIVIMLAISDPRKQLLMLERLMDVFQNEEVMNAIKNAKNQQDITLLLDRELNKVSI